MTTKLHLINYEYFTKLYKKCDNDPDLSDHAKDYTGRFRDSTSDETATLNNSITREELDQALKKLHLNKSTSEDVIYI